MSAQYDAALSVSQLLIGNLLRAGRVQTLTPELIAEQAVAAVSLLGLTDIDPAKLADDLEKHFRIFVDDAAILEDDSGHQRWVKTADKVQWRYWKRYEKHILGNLPEPVVRQIDEDTDRILELLEDPAKPGRWDRRGLVVGDVQFGKTSNYAALVCKAADTGYRIIIILAGMHESLRMQTQIRLDEGFLGYKTDSSRAPTGVGIFDPTLKPIAATTRSLRGDFNKIVANQLAIPFDVAPILLVVKKNSRMLRNLHTWLTKEMPIGGTGGIEAPALLIDDESDNASVDTQEQDFGSGNEPDMTHEPTAINNLIRRILKLFNRKGYVGYTATPFANIFIHKDAKTTLADKDLFPRNFIVNLHAPSNYFGALQAFGLERDDEVSVAAPLVRLIDGGVRDKAELNQWMPRRHKQDHALALGQINVFPASLRRALLSFIIACVVRKLRGHVTDHNSMLVHVTRYTKVQARVYEQISEELTRLRRRLRYGERGAETSVWQEIKNLWTDDFVPTTSQMARDRFDNIGDLPDWQSVEVALPDVVGSIKVKQINGEAQDVLDYDSYKDTGIDVIVIGGDKLSRGLTLYGLTVSYFSRHTDMYDTLLQMGRWFGYRPGYLDVCRLYTTRTLKEAFEHIAVANDELRRDFDYMDLIGKTPHEFGLKVRGHPFLMATSLAKRRHTRDVLVYMSYAGKVSETKSFTLDISVRSQNLQALNQFAETLQQQVPSIQNPKESLDGNGTREYRGSFLWRDVPWDQVCEFLQHYQTEKSAHLANSKVWARYIQRQVREVGELTKWNVALIGSDGDEPETLIAGLTVRMRRRAIDPDVNQAGGYRIKRLVTPRDAGIDLSGAAWRHALQRDPRNRRGVARSEPTINAIAWERQRSGINPLMLIYLPYSGDVTYDGSAPAVVGVALVFPGSNNAVEESVEYTVNSVFLADETADIDDEEWLAEPATEKSVN